MRIAHEELVSATILIVDDEPTNTLILERVLQRAGFANVTSTTNPLEACRLYQSLRPDLLVLDLNMPEMDGFAVMRRLHEAAPDRYLPILVLTGDTDPAVRQRVLDAGAVDFLTKGFDSLEVVTRIRNMLEIRLLYNRLRRQNEILEEAVRERTQQLETANKELSNSNAALQRMDRLKSVFLDVTCHELRTPLMPMGAMLQMMEQRLPPDAEEVRPQLAIARRAAKRLEQQVRQILEVAREGRYGLRLDRRPIDLTRLIHQSLEVVRPFAAARRQELTVTIADALPTVPVDAQKLEDVLQNLLFNAVKFTADGGQISVRATADSADVRVEVRDSGIGIPPADLPHIFEPFFTTFDTMHHSSGDFEFETRGLGLGLAIVKKFVELHGGAVGVESAPGEGARFWFTLPWQAQDR